MDDDDGDDGSDATDRRAVLAIAMETFSARAGETENSEFSYGD